MKRSRSIASAVILSATIAGSLLLASPANAADVTFADPDLQACANQWLGQQPADPVSTTQAASLTLLDCPNMGITLLGGIENFTSLTNLGLRLNSISDLSPVSTLTNLTSLSVYGNQIASIAPVASLTKLTSFVAMDNQISDLAPLSGLSQLVGVAVSGNVITDLSPLSGLSKLESIDADDNEISDLTGLTNLPVLNGITVEGNHITDLSPLGLIADQFQNLFQVHARFQTVTMPDVIVGQSFANPLLDPHGVTVTGVSSNTFDPNFVLAADGASWSYTAPATNELYILQAYPGPGKPAWQLTGVITQNSIAARSTTLVDDTSTTVAGTAITIDVLANDGLPSQPALIASTLTLLDADGNPATQVTVAGGTFEVVDGEIVFTPTAGFTGAVDDVDYQVTNTDGVTGSATIRVTVTATVVPTTDPTSNPGTPSTSGPSTSTSISGTPSSSTGSLASTGFDGVLIVGLGGLAAAAGVILFAAARRRRA